MAKRANLSFSLSLSRFNLHLQVLPYRKKCRRLIFGVGVAVSAPAV